MPETTPIYGFPYPCLYDPVDWADFANLANAIDAKYLELQADADLALNRYNTVRQVADQPGIAVGVETALTQPNATYVIPAAGVYLVFAKYIVVAVTTIASARFRVLLNGTPIFARTYNFEGGNAGPIIDVPPAPLICATGDTVSFSFIYQGSGTATIGFGYVPRMIVRIP